MKVTYRYYRPPKTWGMKWPKKGPPKRGMSRYIRSCPNFRPLERGGITICILEIDGKTYKGVAKCSFSDQFNYKIGRDIATGRALREAMIR